MEADRHEELVNALEVLREEVLKRAGDDRRQEVEERLREAEERFAAAEMERREARDAKEAAAQETAKKWTAADSHSFSIRPLLETHRVKRSAMESARAKHEAAQYRNLQNVEEKKKTWKAQKEKRRVVLVKKGTGRKPSTSDEAGTSGAAAF